MKHEPFPVEGFDFMNDPATDQQKDLIVKLAEEKGKPIKRYGKWPEPFTKFDAANMIAALEEL